MSPRAQDFGAVTDVREKSVFIAQRYRVNEGTYTMLDYAYRKVSNIRRTKCQNLNDSRLVLQLSVPNPLKPSVKSIM